MKWVDVAGVPGSGKSTLCYPVWQDRSVTWDGMPMPEEWQPFMAELVKLFHLVRDHPTYEAVVRMNNRTAGKMATVYRMPPKKVCVGPEDPDDPMLPTKSGPLRWIELPFIQTGWMQRILGFGWRLHQMRRDINMIRPALEIMPVSGGVVFLEADLETLLQRNKDREKVKETAHENRGFQVPHMLACMPLVKQVMRDRGVRVAEIDVQHQSVEEARKQLLEFANVELVAP